MGGDTLSVLSSTIYADDDDISTTEIPTLWTCGGLSDEWVMGESDGRSFRDYQQLIKSYHHLNDPRLDNIHAAKTKVLSYTPGSWVENVGGMTMDDYNVPKTTTLLLIGPKGSGKSSLINRISRVFEDDKFAPERVQVAYNSSVRDGTTFLQEYMIPRNSTSFCLYDTCGFSDNLSDNLQMIKQWMTKSVRHGEFMKSASDSSGLRLRMKYKNGQDEPLTFERRRVDFVIFVVNGLSPSFKLEKAVCSHGFFMTAPNQWNPFSKTFQRPLRLFQYDTVSSSSVTVQISQPPQADHLLVRVLDSVDLSTVHHQSLMEQVRRMLRLSEAEETNVRAFQDMYAEAKASGFGRVFRSPTLFEDMVKCILVCNCQWSRTLSMARALCELQLELQCPASITKFAPKTPAGKESTKRKIKSQEKSRNVVKRCCEDVKSASEEDGTLKIDSFDTSINIHDSNGEKTELAFHGAMGNFPSPEELAGLDLNYLGKRCNLGYRASRILGLAQSVVEGRINLKKLEEDCGRDASLSNYMKINERLGEINGFGPFTRANVLMCLGFYHVIPSDSETLRHLNQVHGKKSTIKNIQQDIEVIYGKYAPYQFLVYWSEIWSFYEERFGNLSELPNTQYKLITAANMRCKNDKALKRFKEEQ